MNTILTWLVAIFLLVVAGYFALSLIVGTVMYVAFAILAVGIVGAVGARMLRG